MELTKKGYLKQLSLYLSNKDYGQAYPLAKQFLEEYPDEMMANYLYATAAFWAGENENAAKYGRMAFNLSKSPDDLLASAIITSSAYYELKQYQKAFDMLSSMEKLKYNEEIEKLLFVFSLALKDEKEAYKHAKNLYVMNKKAAQELLKKFIG